MSLEDRINTLNPMQRQAVLTTEGPLLLLAGAGSGKTRVLTHRIAYLIEQGVRPFNILAITFTNKAAREMKERVSAITEQGDQVWVSTFHSTCVRLLRREIDKIGYSNQFSIYDADDSDRLIKAILKDMNVSTNVLSPKLAAYIIDQQKNNLVTADQYCEMCKNDFSQKKGAEVYLAYQQRLKDNNALDFNDLIFKTIDLFKQRPDILEKYQNRFNYIMVDEYQDTNMAQYTLVKLLASKNKNLCVVGDDDQSIYGWRGADINNILDFEKDFENTKVIKLEQNYRSTDVILNAANAVIKNNIKRKPKSLWTEQINGEKINFYQADNDKSEAKYICDEINKGVTSGREYKDYAVLYRNNSLSRVIEEALIKNDIPYRLFGGTRFYDRKEIRDVMSYLKAIYNPADDIAIRRIINVPKRGIGETSINKIVDYATQNNISFYEAICRCNDIDAIAGARAKSSIIQFASMLNNFMTYADELSVSEVLEKLIDESGYRAELENENTDEAKGRLENIGELINKAIEFEEDNPDDSSLSAFLEEVALVADIDGFNEGDDTIVLMTLHSSKGLEFDTVFIAGFEEMIFPGFRAVSDNSMKEMEEERRLCYVGITRAKKSLYLTCAKTRMLFGHRSYNMPSRFLKEIPKELYESKAENVVKSKVEKSNTYKRPIARHTGVYKMPEPQNVDIDFVLGDSVKHFKFGIGKIVDIKNAGADYEVTVDFDTAGTKKLMAKLAKLKKI